MKTQTLTSRNGKQMKAAVTYHRNLWTGRMACGMAIESIRSQTFNLHQTAISADHSDANCAACRKAVA